MNQVQKDLTQAAELIRKHGWIKGRSGNKEEGFCLAGALAEVFCSNPFEFEDYSSETLKVRFAACLRTVQTALNKKTVLSIMIWNDARETTKEDVLQLIQKAIEEAACLSNASSVSVTVST